MQGTEVRSVVPGLALSSRPATPSSSFWFKRRAIQPTEYSFEPLTQVSRPSWQGPEDTFACKQPPGTRPPKQSAAALRLSNASPLASPRRILNRLSGTPEAGPTRSARNSRPVSPNGRAATHEELASSSRANIQDTVLAAETITNQMDEVLDQICHMQQYVQQLLADQRAAEERDEEAVALLLELVAVAEQEQSSADSPAASIARWAVRSRRGAAQRQAFGNGEADTAGKPPPLPRSAQRAATARTAVQARLRLKSALKEAWENPVYAPFRANPVPLSTSKPRFARLGEQARLKRLSSQAAAIERYQRRLSQSSCTRSPTTSPRAARENRAVRSPRQSSTVGWSPAQPRAVPSPTWQQERLVWMEADALARQAITRAHAESALAAAQPPSFSTDSQQAMAGSLTPRRSRLAQPYV